MLKHSTDPGSHVYSHQKEIVLDNSHPEFSQRLQPDTYRNIDPKKYEKFLKAARNSLQKKGKYVKSEIADLAGISRRSVTKYFKKAIETGDLEG